MDIDFFSLDRALMCSAPIDYLMHYHSMSRVVLIFLFLRKGRVLFQDCYNIKDKAITEAYIL